MHPAAKKIILVLWLVLFGVATASASIPRTSENRVWENFSPAQNLHQAESLQIVESHPDEIPLWWDLASNQTVPVNLMDPFGLGPQLTGMQQGLVNALNFVSGLLSPFRMLMSNPADAHSDGNGLRNIANISTSTFNPARQVVNDDLSINYRGLGSTVSGLALGAFMENPGLLSSGRNLLTVDDFMVQAQTRLNAVKVEFGNIEAFNIVTPQPVSLSRLNAPLTRLFADPGKLARHGEFDWNKYTPILVEERNGILTIQDGMTRFENARQAGITELPAYVFPSR